MAYRPTKKIHLLKKCGILCEAFLRFQGEKRIKHVSYKTLEVYENAWKFFGSHLETFGQMTSTDADFDGPANRRQWEKRIVHLIHTAIAERQESENPVSPLTVNVYLRVINTFLKWPKDEDETLNNEWKSLRSKCRPATGVRFLAGRKSWRCKTSSPNRPTKHGLGQSQW